jgi:hypothetical protein
MWLLLSLLSVSGPYPTSLEWKYTHTLQTAVAKSNLQHFLAQSIYGIHIPGYRLSLPGSVFW